MTAAYNADLSVGYSSELLSFEENEQMFLALNPMSFAESFGEGQVTFISPVIELTLFLDLKPFRLTPLDF